MNPADKAQAIEIISKQKSVKVSFNLPRIDNYSNVHEILIHESNATTIKELIASGFSLFMASKGLSIDKL